MLDAYIYETQQLLEALENTLLAGESGQRLNADQIGEIFRIMHTIKGASAMMEFEELSVLAHKLEDMFALIRDGKDPGAAWPALFDVMFSSVSFFNAEMAKLLEKEPPNGDSAPLRARVEALVQRISGGTGEQDAPPAAADAAEAVVEAEEAAPEEAESAAVDAQEGAPGAEEACYKAVVTFEKDCQMENLRAFGIVQALQQMSVRFAYAPADLTAKDAAEEIVKNGFILYIRTGESPADIKALIDETLFVKSVRLTQISEDSGEIPAELLERAKPSAGAPAAAKAPAAEPPAVKAPAAEAAAPAAEPPAPEAPASDANGGAVSFESIAKQNFISVSVNKLDSLLNIVGEIVTAQSMVINNADFGDRPHESFDMAAQQLHSLINELQDIVMSIRMIPMSTLFQKMRRLVRDMSRRFGKQIQLEIIGEETEVDKNVIDYLSDPLLHIIRNSVDHGVEKPEVRRALGKPETGKIVLEAKMTGSDVVVTISDDGAGLNKEKILQKAKDKGLLTKPESEMTDREIYNLIFLPGFSTKDEVTEYSGRGVGMDVVRKNIAYIGGAVTVDSTPGKGTVHTIRIPLTLTIVDGMKFNVGKMNFIVPTVNVLSAIKPSPDDVFKDPEGNEMMMILGKVYPLIRLSEFFNIHDAVTEVPDGMVMHLSSDERDFCIFFDHLDGEYQVVVKKLPGYLEKCSSSLNGIGGCAILGDGSINLIVDVNGLAAEC
jgi:two-component system chemotaxis sensor kinase CheA